MSSSPPSPVSTEQSPALPRTWPQRMRAYEWLWYLAGFTLLSDQLTKAAIVATIPFGVYPGSPGARPLFDHIFYLVHVGNTGAAWSLFTGKSAWLAVLAAGTLAAIFIWRHSLGLRQRLPQLAFGLLIGGVVGNLIDRIRLGYVVDFLDVHLGSYIYPTFNIADSGICLGVGMYILWSIRQPAPGDVSKTKHPENKP